MVREESCHLEQPHLENKSTASWATLCSWKWQAWVMILSQCKLRNSWDCSTISDLEKFWIISSSQTLNAVSLCKIFCISYCWCPGSLSRQVICNHGTVLNMQDKRALVIHNNNDFKNLLCLSFETLWSISVLVPFTKPETSCQPIRSHHHHYPHLSYDGLN